VREYSEVYRGFFATKKKNLCQVCSWNANFWTPLYFVVNFQSVLLNWNELMKSCNVALIDLWLVWRSLYSTSCFLFTLLCSFANSETKTVGSDTWLNPFTGLEVWLCFQWQQGKVPELICMSTLILAFVQGRKYLEEY